MQLAINLKVYGLIKFLKKSFCVGNVYYGLTFLENIRHKNLYKFCYALVLVIVKYSKWTNRSYVAVYNRSFWIYFICMVYNKNISLYVHIYNGT